MIKEEHIQIFSEAWRYRMPEKELTKLFDAIQLGDEILVNSFVSKIDLLKKSYEPSDNLVFEEFKNRLTESSINFILKEIRDNNKVILNVESLGKLGGDSFERE